MNILNKVVWAPKNLFGAFLFLVILFFSTTVSVQGSCGFITSVFGDDSAITDCDNPLGVENPNSNLTVEFAGETIIDGGTILLSSTNGTFTYDGIGSQINSVFTTLYRHDGENYIAEIHNNEPYTFTATGTYSFVVKEDSFIFSDGFLNKLKEFILLTAHAASGKLTIFTFDVVEPTSEPLGASSVLFLPGIQASRLYTKDGSLTENQLWEPNRNADVEKLRMTSVGQSVNDIYTRDIIDEVIIPGLGVDVYKGFNFFMNQLVVDGEIDTWSPFAYDWRKDVFDIVENGTAYSGGVSTGIVRPIQEIERLAATSYTGKVTLIAHSNGGLLAKAIMLKLAERGDSNLVDKIVFIGTPHLGTPKAIATMLHGYDQEKLGGAVIDDSTARDVMRNMPGAYGLLPSAKYLDVMTEPLVAFDESVSTNKFRNAYGSEVNTYSELIDFMNGVEDSVGRSSTGFGEVNEPTIANSTMLANSVSSHQNLLDDWVAPDEVQVFEIVGTGLLTMKALKYREVEETVCSFVLLCDVQKILKPHALLTKYGDETVVSASASATVAGKKLYYLDLRNFNDDIFFSSGDSYSHSNITEIDEVQTLIQRIMFADNTKDIEYISTEQPSFSETYEIEEINSPVQIYATDLSGNVTGVVEEGGQLVTKKEIPGSYYFEFGTTKYLVLPSGTRRTTTLRGEGHGGYTLTVSSLDDSDYQQVIHEIKNASTTPEMVATYTRNEAGYGDLETDLDGDGNIDLKTTLDGEVMGVVVTYESLYQAINSLELSASYKAFLSRLAKLSESYNDKAQTLSIYKRVEKTSLKNIERTIGVYKRMGLLNTEQVSEVLLIIKELTLKI